MCVGCWRHLMSLIYNIAAWTLLLPPFQGWETEAQGEQGSKGQVNPVFPQPPGLEGLTGVMPSSLHCCVWHRGRLSHWRGHSFIVWGSQDSLRQGTGSLCRGWFGLGHVQECHISPPAWCDGEWAAPLVYHWEP